MNNKTVDNKSNDIEILNVLYDEWKFRLSQYWSITSKTVILDFILFFIPYMKDAWGVNSLNFPNYIFPIAGIIFSIATCFISSIEMIKINRIKNSIKNYISNQTYNFENPYGNNNAMHQNIPILICCVQIIIGVIVFFAML